jgi:membrane protein implicated in regulation of membrane protease activity
MRQAWIGLGILLFLLLAAATVTVTLFLGSGAFDADGIAMLAGTMVSYLLAGALAARIFLREIRRLKNRRETRQVEARWFA